MEQKDEMATNETAENEETVRLEPENEQAAAVLVQETPVVPTEPVLPAEPVVPAAPALPAEPIVTAAPVGGNIPAEETPKKQVNKKKVLVVIGAVAAAVVVAFVVLFIAVIQPNSIYQEACEALEDEKFTECQELLDKIPNHKKTPVLKRDLNIAIAENYIKTGELDLAEGILATMPGDTDAQVLKSDIIYKRASNAIDHKKYDEAQEFMEKIPNHKDPENLRAKLTYQDALQCIEQGDYETGYEMMSSLGDYEDAVEQKEMMYYEALAFVSLLEIQSTLKNPASMRVTDVGFYIADTETTKDFHIVHKITASNSYGGNVGGYVYDTLIYKGLEEGDNDPGMMDHSSYADPDGDNEKLEAAIIEAILTLYEKKECSVDIARMNRLLENKVTFKIDLDFQSDETVEN